ncbi:hypothetical protein ACFO0N_05775 [Halobium salinum]|uniref:DUF8159 domain-containing protein n=1 Tax=Halobium salinum TaxID=1364940 RepID=A0ABD5P9X3_9EURY|nr:hypothetical protein [Halobium salinum]
MSDDMTGLEAELRSNGISVEALSRGDQVELTYLTAFPGERVHHPEMGRALNTFIDLVEDDRWEPARVEATVVRADDDVQGTWHAEPEWFDALCSYRISETEFSTRVLDTLEESVDEESETLDETADASGGAA